MGSEKLNVTKLIFLKYVTLSIVDSQISLSKDWRIQSRDFRLNKGTAFSNYGRILQTPLTQIDGHTLKELEVMQVVCVLSHFSSIWLCDPMDCSLPGSSVHGILQARILEWVAMPSSRVSFWPWDRIWVSYIAGGFFTAEPWEALMDVYICPNLSDWHFQYR